MRPGNGHISAFPEPNYVILEPLESQEHVLYLVTLYLSGIFTHNRAADRSFKRPVATGCSHSHSQSRPVLRGCGCGCAELGCPKDRSQSGCAQKGQKTGLDQTFKLYMQVSGDAQSLTRSPTKVLKGQLGVYLEAWKMEDIPHQFQFFMLTAYSWTL